LPLTACHFDAWLTAGIQWNARKLDAIPGKCPIEYGRRPSFPVCIASRFLPRSPGCHMAKPAKKPPATIHPRIRVVHGEDIAMGPGKCELLALIHSTGSLRRAAMEMGMSYMRAWTLIKTMEKCYRHPLVTLSRGGATGGGAELTPTGKKVLELYAKMEDDSQRVIKPSWQELKKLLRP
jgi:molybdate transport system regulatory protein